MKQGFEMQTIIMSQMKLKFCHNAS